MPLLSVDKFLFILMLGFLFTPNPIVLALGMTSPISVKIEMDKDSFRLPEPVDGKIILTNESSANLQAVFDISIFLNDVPQQSYSIAFKSIFQGVNSFSFGDFNIHLPTQVGKWRIVIKQQNLDENQAATANFVVEPVSEEI